MDSASGDVDHVSGIDVDPVEHFLGTVLMNRFFQLRGRVVLGGQDVSEVAFGWKRLALSPRKLTI